MGASWLDWGILETTLMELGTTFKWNLVEIMWDLGTQLVSLYLNNLGHRIIVFSSVLRSSYSIRFYPLSLFCDQLLLWDDSQIPDLRIVKISRVFRNGHLWKLTLFGPGCVDLLWVPGGGTDRPPSPWIYFVKLGAPSIEILGYLFYWLKMVLGHI